MKHPLRWVFLAYLFAGCEPPSKDLVVSGRVEVDDVHIGSKIGGRVLKVNYEEGDSCTAGDAVVQLEDQEIQAQLERLRNGARPEEIAAARAAVEAASANVARLASQLEETQILAPFDSTVETLDLEPGDLVKAGQTVAVLDLKNTPWVRCYVPENRLGWMKPGNTVQVSVDTFPGRLFPGRIRRLNSEAEFTPRNIQTTEKRAELVFEMKVDVIEAGEDLRAGMYADVIIEGVATTQ